MDDMLMESDGVSGELMPVSDEEWERMQQARNEGGNGE